MSAAHSPRSEMFGEILRHLRTSRALSQEELAHESGLHRTSISGWEMGQHSPSLDTLFALAEALDVSATEIVRRIEAAEP